MVSRVVRGWMVVVGILVRRVVRVVVVVQVWSSVVVVLQVVVGVGLVQLESGA